MNCFRLPRIRKATSVIALQSFSQSSDEEFKFYFMDEQAKKVEEANLKLDYCYMRKEYPVMLYDSCDGFLLLKNRDFYCSRPFFVIWNPTTNEQVTIRGHGFQVCGFYFNPHDKEYEVLLIYPSREGGIESYAFDILSLGSKTLRRNIGRYAYMPRSERPPTIINGKLYWMVDKINSRGEVNCSNAIMAFEIRTNKLSTVQHGGGSCEEGANVGLFGHKHDYMHLIEMEGKLGLCVLSSPTELVLRVLNPVTNSWAKAHSVTLPGYTLPKYFSCWPNKLDVEVVKIKDRKLLVRQKDRLLLWDLDLNTHNILEKKGFENDIFRPAIHTPSAVSLKTDKLIELLNFY